MAIPKSQAFGLQLVMDIGPFVDLLQSTKHPMRVTSKPLTTGLKRAMYKNFMQLGRPTKWVALSEWTKKARKARGSWRNPIGGGGEPILQETNRLLIGTAINPIIITKSKSLHYKLNYFDLRRARRLQQGDPIQWRPGMPIPKTKPRASRSFVRQQTVVFGHQLDEPIEVTVNYSLPARPFFGITGSDAEKIAASVVKFIAARAKKRRVRRVVP